MRLFLPGKKLLLYGIFILFIFNPRLISGYFFRFNYCGFIMNIGLETPFRMFAAALP